MIHKFEASVGEPEFEQANIEKYFKLFVYMHLSVFKYVCRFSTLWFCYVLFEMYISTEICLKIK